MRLFKIMIVAMVLNGLFWWLGSLAHGRSILELLGFSDIPVEKVAP
jgi:hypothetical protein